LPDTTLHDDSAIPSNVVREEIWDGRGIAGREGADGLPVKGRAYVQEGFLTPGGNVID
jgi:hypothetical protein